MGAHFLLWGIFRTQGLNSRLLHWQARSSPLSHLGSGLSDTNFGWVYSAIPIESWISVSLRSSLKGYGVGGFLGWISWRNTIEYIANSPSKIFTMYSTVLSILRLPFKK